MYILIFVQYEKMQKGMKNMDYNQMPFGFEFAFAGDRMIDGYSNMSDDEKREYIERNRNRLSEHELDKLTASLGKEEEEVPHFDNPSSLFRGPGIG